MESRPRAYFVCRNGLGGYVQIFDRKKYRLFGVVNLIDLVVLVAVLVAGFAVYRVLTNSKQSTAAGTGQPITFTVMCPSLRSVGPEQIKVGDSLYKNTGKLLGKVTAVRGVPTPGDAWDPSTSTIKHYSSTTLTDIYIDVEGNGTPTASGIGVGDLLLHGNQPMPIMTSTFECDTANITTMTIVGQ
jgi:hypothetical protein